MVKKSIISLLVALFLLSLNSLNATANYDNSNLIAQNLKSKSKEDDREHRVVSTTRDAYKSVRESLIKDGWTIDEIIIKGDDVTIKCSRPKQSE